MNKDKEINNFFSAVNSSEKGVFTWNGHQLPAKPTVPSGLHKDTSHEVKVEKIFTIKKRKLHET